MSDEIHKKEFNLNETLPLNKFLKIFFGKGMLKPQTFWLKNFKGMIAMDFIGRFENLDRDISKVCKMINVPNVELPH